MRAAEADHFSEFKKNNTMVVESKNIMTPEQNKEPTLARVPNHQHCSDDDSEENPEEDQEKEIYEEFYEDAKDVRNEEPEEDLEVVMYEEFDEDPVDVIDEEPEEDPEEEIYEESDQGPEDVIYEEPEENPEKEMDEEPEEDPEEEIVEDPEEDSEEEMDVESEEEELVVENSCLSCSRNGSTDIKDLGHKLNEGLKEERGKKVIELNATKPISNIDTLSESHHSNNMTNPVEDRVHYLLKEHVLNSSSKAGDQFKNSSKFGSVTLAACKLQKKFMSEGYLKSESDGPSAVRELDSEVGLLKIIVNDDRTSKLQEPGTSSRKHKHSRWDLKQEGETPLIDGTSKRRKTRWDNDDSQNCLFQLSGFLSSLELSTDPKILNLEKRSMAINKMLQSSEIYGNRPAEEISPPKPDNNNLDIRISEQVWRKLTKERQSILSQLTQTFKTPDKFIKKIFVPVEEYPTYNFIGLILGPRGYTQKKMEKETGAKILLRGKGSRAPDQDENLHVLVEADNQQALGAAVDMIERLLIPVADQNNDHKRAQLAELAKLRGKYKDSNICPLCKEQGHLQYACPIKDSTFKSAYCDICGSFGHSTSKCNSKDKSNQEVDNANIYVGFLSHATDEKRLKELFLPFGKIIKTTVIKDQTTGLSKGYGFVKFDNPSDAAAAVTYMNGYKMDGKFLAVRVAGQKPVPGPLPTAVPSIISSQTSCIFDPVASMLPQAQVSISNKESLYFPLSSGNAARTVALSILPYIVPSTTKPRMASNYPSRHEIYSQIPSSFPNSLPQFPGNPDYPISKSKSYFTSPTLDEFQTSHFSRMPETDQKSVFGSASQLPWQDSLQNESPILPRVTPHLLRDKTYFLAD